MRIPLLVSSTLSLALGIATTPASADPVEIFLGLSGAAPPQGAITTTLTAVATQGLAEGEGLREFQVTALAPGKVRLNLAPGVAWRLTADALDYWSPPIVIVPPRGSAGAAPPSAAMELLPTGTVAGTLKLPRHEGTPDELNVRFQSAPSVPAAEAISESTMPCEIEAGEAEAGRWRCRVPAGRLDLRLRVPGFVSHFAWDAEIQAGERFDFGALELRRGASLIGWVEAQTGPLTPERCRVELSPTVTGRATDSDRERIRQLTLKAEITERGFFHFPGIAPGSYRLRASQLGRGVGELFPLSVIEGAETEIRQPLELEPPMDLAISVEPPLDPFDRPWTVAVSARSDIPGSLESLDEEVMAEDGTFLHKELNPGSYMVEIFDADRGRMATEEIELGPSSGPLHFELPLTWVEGSLRLGDEPLMAQLWFGGFGGGQRVVLETDEEGHFTGTLPREGIWKVLVIADSPSVRHTFPTVEVQRVRSARSAKVDLALPATAITGEVVDENGEPVLDAVIRMVELDRFLASSGKSDENGEFEFHGLAEGAHTLRAEVEGKSSEEMVVQVVEDQESPAVRLVLQKMEPVKGRVLAGAVGVPGARVLILGFEPGQSRPVPRGFQAATDVEGRFNLPVPTTFDRLQVTVFPAGYALEVLQVERDRAENLTIEVEPHGGTLTLELAQTIDWARQDTARPVVVFDGLVIDIQTLFIWAHTNGEDNTSRRRFVVPNLPAGSYQACVATAGSFLRSSASGGPAGCRQGYLSPLGDLTLSFDS